MCTRPRPPPRLLKNHAPYYVVAITQAARGFPQVNLYCHDEARFGLFNRPGSGLTAKGVKPVCPFQQVFLSTWLFGAYSPITDDYLHLELSHCSSATFQVFLDHFAAERPGELKVMLLDNGAFHKARRLTWPSNILPLFLPPYSPAPDATPGSNLQRRSGVASSGRSPTRSSHCLSNSVRSSPNKSGGWALAS